MIPDFTNPAAEETWFSKRNYLTEMGIDGFKTDGGEFIYREDVRFADGSSGRAGKNRYAQEYTAAYTKHLGSAQALFSRRATLVSIPRLSIGLEISSPRTASWPAPCGRGCPLP